MITILFFQNEKKRNNFCLRSIVLFDLIFPNYIKGVKISLKKKEMDSFPRETRHRLHQLETTKDVDLVAKKFLCTQLPKFVDFRGVYPFISDDLEAIDFRAPGVLNDYAYFRHVDPKEFHQLLLLGGEENLKRAKQVPVFVDFCERVQPPKGKELVAFFIHGQLKKNLIDHVSELFDNDDEKRRLLKALRDYTVPETLQMGNELTETLGMLLADLILSTDNVLVEQGNNEQQEEEEESVEEEEEETMASSLPTSESKSWNEEEHWENPVLKAFKVEAGLSTQFPSKNAYKQMAISSLAAPGYSPPRFILGKFQSGNSLPPVEDRHVVASVLVEHAPTETIERIAHHSNVQSYYYRNKASHDENRGLVKAYLVEHAGNVSHEIIEELINIL